MSSLMKKFFNGIIPYHRSFAVFDETTILYEDGKVYEQAAITLPLVSSAVMFMQNEDTFIIDNTEDINKLPYIDYQLIGTDKINGGFRDDFNSFSNMVKIHIGRMGVFSFSVEKRVVYNNNVHIKFKVKTNTNI